MKDVSLMLSQERELDRHLQAKRQIRTWYLHFITKNTQVSTYLHDGFDHKNPLAYQELKDDAFNKSISGDKFITE